MFKHSLISNVKPWCGPILNERWWKSVNRNVLLALCFDLPPPIAVNKEWRYFAVDCRCTMLLFWSFIQIISSLFWKCNLNREGDGGTFKGISVFCFMDCWLEVSLNPEGPPIGRLVTDFLGFLSVFKQVLRMFQSFKLITARYTYNPPPV